MKKGLLSWWLLHMILWYDTWYMTFCYSITYLLSSVGLPLADETLVHEDGGLVNPG